MGNYGDAFAQAIADQLRAERSVVKMSQKRIAELAGVSEQTVMRYLNGTRDIPMSVLADISEAMGLSIETIVQRASERMPAQHDYDLVAHPYTDEDGEEDHN